MSRAWHRAATFLLALALVGLGVAALVRTAMLGGGIGYLLGGLLIAAGGLRVYFEARR